MKAFTCLRLLLALLACACGPAQATFSCNVTATSLGVIYRQGFTARTDVVGTVHLNCTRDLASDPNTLTYRIGVDLGDNYQNPNRRVRLGASGNYLAYSLARGASVGGAATCSDNSNWGLPVLTSDVMAGTLNFGAGAAATATWGFCVRVRGNQGRPAAGEYEDSPTVIAQYPATLTGALAFTSFTYTVGARNQCVLNTFPADMVFNYNSFQPAPQVVTQTFRLACNTGLPWSVAISPPGGTLLGLNYTLTRSPATGVGNSNPQTVVITGTIPAGQQGSCGTGSCSDSQTHTLTISY